MEEEKYIYDNYDILEIIMKNNIYEIKKGYDKKYKKFVEIKIIEKKNILIFNQKSNSIISKIFKNRIYELRNYNSENFINLIDFFETKNKYFIITELSDTNLENYLSKNNLKLTIEEIKHLINKLNIGFNELIKNNRINIDIKIKDILINFSGNDKDINNNKLKINLFGLNNLLIYSKISLVKENNSDNYIIEKNNEEIIK